MCNKDFKLEIYLFCKFYVIGNFGKEIKFLFSIKFQTNSTDP